MTMMPFPDAENWLTVMENDADARDREDVGHVLGFLRPYEFPPPGRFVTKLIDAVFKADNGNQLRLALGFPVIVGAVRAYQQVDGAEERLVAIVRGGAR